MTLEELAAYPKPAVGTKIVAEILGCDRYSLNIAAKQGNFPRESYFFSGNRLYISKDWLLKFCGYKVAEESRGNTVLFPPVKAVGL